MSVFSEYTTWDVINALKPQAARIWNSSSAYIIESQFNATAAEQGFYKIGTDCWIKNIGTYKTAADIGVDSVINSSAATTALAENAATAAGLEGGTTGGNALAMTSLTTDATTGAVTSAEGVGAAGTIAGSVAAGACAVAAGALLGVGLYNADPAFWTDLDHYIGEKTPWTWDDIPMYEAPTDTTGTATTYLPADFITSVYNYMYNKGAFSGYKQTTYSTLNYKGLSGISLYNMTGFWNSASNPTYLKVYPDTLICFTTTSATAGQGVPGWYVLRKSEFFGKNVGSGNAKIIDFTQASTDGINIWKVTVNGDTFWKTQAFTSYKGNPALLGYPYTIVSSSSEMTNQQAHDLLFKGTAITVGGYDGITTIDGATYPTSADNDLATLYPDWWAKKQTINGLTGSSSWLPVTLPTADPTTTPISGTQPAAQTGTKTTGDEQYPTDDDIVTKIKSILDLPTVTPTPITGNTPTAVVPTGSAKAMWTIYNPTQAQVESLGAWLWSSNFVDQLIKMFNSPAEAIITLHKIFITPTTGDSADIKVGYLDSGVSSLAVTKQYESYDCGTVSLKEYFGNCEDYGRFTGVQLYLPFIGFVKLSTNDVMASTINVTYRVDNYTGACLAIVTVTKNSGALVLYQYGGNMAVHYPLSAGSFASVLTSLIGTAAGVAGTIATGGALAPVLMGGGMSLLNSRASVNVSGGFNANTGAMGTKTPYLVITRPRIYNAANYNNYYGYPNNMTVTLSSCTGFTRVKNVFTTVSKATDAEKTEIESILKEGVLL